MYRTRAVKASPLLTTGSMVQYGTSTVPDYRPLLVQWYGTVGTRIRTSYSYNTVQ